jgi:tetratricopeptide (TPR) repeat protein
MPLPPGTSARGSRSFSAALLLLPAVFAAGAFLPGAGAWGFNALAYLPRPVFFLWGVGVLAALGLVLRPGILGRATASAASFLLEARWAGALAAVAGAAVFLLLRSRSFFFGDGPLFAELAAKGAPFHGFDDMHFALFAWIYRLCLRWREIDPFLPFRAASVLAGVLAVILAIPLVRRLPWSGRSRLLVLGWFFATGPVALFFGYVEVYSFLLALLTAFLLAGLLALWGRAPLWWAGLLFAGAMLFQLTAVFSAGALLVLFLRAPEKSWRRRFLALALPSIAVGLLWILIHLVLGWEQGWFRRGSPENENVRTLILPLGGGHGFFSFAHWRDMLNLALVTAPVPLLVVLFHLRSLRARLGEPAVQFLLAQAGVLLLASLLLDRKLGTARDWDLLAAHVPGLILLAGMLWTGEGEPPGPGAVDAGGGGLLPEGRASAAPRGAAAALLVSLLVTAPWILLIHRDQDSARWLADVAQDFGDPAQPYAYEELGKHYRNRGDYDRAEEMYLRCVQAGPDNPRFHVVLGTTYAVRGKLDLANREYEIARRGYESALKANPDDVSSKRRLAQILAWQGKAAQAADLFQDLTRARPKDASLWVSLGQAALSADQPELAARALTRARELNPRLAIDHDLGVAWIGLERWDEAAAAFRRALRRTEDPSTRIGLAGTLVSAAEARLRAGDRPDPQGLTEAEENLRVVLRGNGADPDAGELLRRVQLLRRGIDPEEGSGDEAPPGGR